MKLVSVKSGWVRLCEKTGTMSETILSSFTQLHHRGLTASIMAKCNFDFSNAICIHDNLNADFQYASELVDAIKFRLREKLRRNGRKPREEADGRRTKERKEDRTGLLQFMNVNDVRVGEAPYLLLSIPLHASSTTVSYDPYIFAWIWQTARYECDECYVRVCTCKCEHARETRVFGSTCEGRSAPCESASWMRNWINFWLVITTPCHEPRFENCWQSSLLFRLSHTPKKYPVYITSYLPETRLPLTTNISSYI